MFNNSPKWRRLSRRKTTRKRAWPRGLMNVITEKSRSVKLLSHTYIHAYIHECENWKQQECKLWSLNTYIHTYMPTYIDWLTYPSVEVCWIEWQKHDHQSEARLLHTWHALHLVTKQDCPNARVAHEDQHEQNLCDQTWIFVSFICHLWWFMVLNNV